MKIIIAPDSYKGSLSSIEVGEAMKRGLSRALPAASCHVVPMADGGEGTMEALLYSQKGEKIELDVKGPLGRVHQASIALSTSKELAIIESASIIGLPLLKAKERNPLESTSYGLGQAILHCLEKGVRQFIIGLGGSATNDGGLGLLEAFGANFYQGEEKITNLRTKDLQRITHVDMSAIDPRLEQSTLTLATDVQNPLCGEQGASAVFGPQKGATTEMIPILDDALAHYASLFTNGTSLMNQPGAGAAGGLGFAFMLLKASMRQGAEIVAEQVGLDQLLEGAQLLMTGEGQTDQQTLYGKAPFYIAQRAKAYHVPTVFISGSLGKGHQALSAEIEALFSIVQRPASLEEAMEHGAAWVEESAFYVGRLLALGGKLC